MAEVKWVKLKINMFEDDKIEYIESLPECDTILIIWFKLLALAGKCNFGGFIHLTEDIPYTADMLAHKFRRPLNTIKLALATFEKIGMIDIIDGRICLTDFSSEQNEDKLAAIRDYNRKAKQTERARKKLLLSSNEKISNTINEMSMTNVNDSQGNCQTDSIDDTLTCHGSQKTDEDIDKDKDYKDDDNDINNTMQSQTTSSTTLLTFSDNTTVDVFYKKNIGLLSPVITENINYYRKQGLSEDVIKMSIMTAVANSTASNDKKNWSYINAILEDCLKKNIKTLEQYELKETAFQQRKQAVVNINKKSEVKNKSSTGDLGDVIGQYAFKV